MTNNTHASVLQESYRQLIQPYAAHISIAATLTIKQVAKVRVKRFENYSDECYTYNVALDEDKLNSTIKYFTARLTHALYGNQAKHKNKQDWAKPLIITAIEGREKFKRQHLHLAIGNIPVDKHDSIATLIEDAWRGCDFANKQIKIKPIYNGIGWLNYMTKDVGYTGSDVIDVIHSVVPEFIQHSICTESRLQAV